jgi:hypothetical protein
MKPAYNFCLLSDGREEDWKRLYRAEFPKDEQHPEDDLQRLIAKGSVLLHRTTNENGELLCFSLVHIMSNFNLLAYIATDRTKQSGGVGSQHMKHLIDWLKKKYPTHLGMFFDIESTLEKGLAPEVEKMRKRRLTFYERLGAQRSTKPFWMPIYGYAKDGATNAKEAELLWFNFVPCVTNGMLPGVISEIYARGYAVPASDPLTDRVLKPFRSDEGDACANMYDIVLNKDGTVITGADAKPTQSNTEPKEPKAEPAEPKGNDCDCKCRQHRCMTCGKSRCANIMKQATCVAPNEAAKAPDQR